MRKITIAFQTPDAVHYALENQMMTEDYPDEADETYIDGRKERYERAINKFVKWGELVTIEIDPDTNTARVIPIL